MARARWSARPCRWSSAYDARKHERRCCSRHPRASGKCARGTAHCVAGDESAQGSGNVRGLKTVSTIRHDGGIVRQKSIAIDHGRRSASAVRLGIVTASRLRRQRNRRRSSEIAAQVGTSSTRTYYRTMRVLKSVFALSFIPVSYQLQKPTACLVAIAERLRRFEKLITAFQKPPKAN